MEVAPRLKSWSLRPEQCLFFDEIHVKFDELSAENKHWSEMSSLAAPNYLPRVNQSHAH